jgi:RNA polymerase sigma-70 factor, ECF subfamily
VQAAVTPASRDAVEALYRADGDRIWRAVWAFTQDPDVASDAVAEAFAQALARGPAIKSPAAWIWRTVFRIAAGMLQQRRRTVSLDREVSYEMPDGNQQLLSALHHLPPHQRAAVVLFYYADHPVREIAVILQSSALAVRVNLSRGRARLRKILENSDA